MELLPKISIDLATMRKQVKGLGYSIRTKVLSFSDLSREERRSWVLVSQETKEIINPCNTYFQGTAFYQRHQSGFDFINRITLKGN